MANLGGKAKVYIWPTTGVILSMAQASQSCAVDQRRTTGADKAGAQIMTTQKTNCTSNSILRSQSFINFILKDIVSTYTQNGGGSITALKEAATNSYEVSIAQEERMDVLTYELAIDESCTVTLLKKNESTISFGH